MLLDLQQGGIQCRGLHFNFWKVRNMGGAAICRECTKHRIRLVLNGDAVLHPEHIVHLVHLAPLVFVHAVNVGVHCEGYHSNKRSYHEIRRASDRLCKEHGLSVIVPGRDKGKSYIEHQATQNGISYKAKLKAATDRLIPVSSSLEDLIVRLQREGYEIKRGKYVSARAPDQERFTRLRTPGADYTEEAVVSRIAGGPRPSRQPRQRSGKVNLLIDIQNNIKPSRASDTSGGRPLRI